MSTEKAALRHSSSADASPPQGVNPITPEESAVTEGMADIERIKKPTSQVVEIIGPDGDVRDREQMTVSALARIGPGYVLHFIKGLKLTAAEDPEIDAKAAKAVWSNREYERWVHTERDKHFLKIVKDSGEQVTHFLCGYGHNLADDAEAAGVTLIVVRLKAVVADKKKEEERIAKEKAQQLEKDKRDKTGKQEFIPFFFGRP